jgi:DUF4097 and DUF4098 domain-containing protein YvlB
MGHTRYEARYTLHVPSSFSADLDTSGGDVSANGLTGNVKVDTSGGDLTFSQIHGDIHADTSGGDIIVKGCDGTTNLDTSGGRIEVTDGRGKLDAETSGGAVTVLIAGDTKVRAAAANSASATSAAECRNVGGSVSAILPSPVVGDVRLKPPVAASPS